MLLFVHVPELTIVVPAEIPLTKTSIVVPLASVLVPRRLVAPEQIGESTIGGAELARTNTEVEGLLSHLPGAVARAVMTSPPNNELNPLRVHTPPVAVIVPTLIPFTKTSISLPSTSVLVPETDVAPEQISDATSGADASGLTATRKAADPVPSPHEFVALTVRSPAVAVEE